MIHSRLDLIRHWPELAHAAGYCAALLAAQCSVSTRQLERFIRAKMANSPHKWLRKMRMDRAVELLQRKTPLKQIADELGYSSAAHFSRDFKDFFGLTPSQFLLQAATAVTSVAPVAFLQ